MADLNLTLSVTTLNIKWIKHSNQKEGIGRINFFKKIQICPVYKRHNLYIKTQRD